MQSTSKSIRECALTSGQRVLVEVGEIVGQEYFTFVSLGVHLVAGMISGRSVVYIFSQSAPGEVYKYRGNMSIAQGSNGIVLVDLNGDGLLVKAACDNHVQVVSRRYLPGE